MEIVTKNVDELKPYKNNPRKNEKAVDYVANSIKEFGFKVPVVIDENNVIVTGHTRVLASKKLGIKEIPCIVASDLTPEQIRAFRLADNKVSEFSKWDVDLLLTELDDIDLDMNDFGFSISYIEPEEKENERHRTNDTYNLDLVDFEGSTNDFWQMPVINNDNYIPKELIGFNYAKSNDRKDVGIHFYIDDYQFERVWNNPQDYVDVLKQYECILSPDFSLYMDMPMPMKIWNIYRSRVIGQYYQQQGIKVIPTMSWAEKETFDFCFKGIPQHSVVSISTIGVKRSTEAFKIWREGMDAMIAEIQPSTILVYGGKVDYDYGDIDVRYYENQVTEKFKKE